MDKNTLVDKLQHKTNISYEEAKDALENSNWDILDAMLYLEKCNIIEKPSISIFCTNEHTNNSANHGEVMNISENTQGNNKKNTHEGIFEAVCKAIDTCNNIFIEIKKSGRILLKLPLTVIILLFLFTFWLIIPLTIVALFFDIEFLVSAKRINIDKVNKVLSDLSMKIQIIKNKFKKGDDK